MTEFYAEIRLVHIAAVIASGALFVVRGLSLFAGLPLARAMPVRILAMTIDTTLLTAALMLMVIVQQYPFKDAWLTVKVGLVICYIVLGFVTFWRARTRKASVAAWVAALAVYAFIVTIARSHSPWGFFAA